MVIGVYVQKAASHVKRLQDVDGAYVLPQLADESEEEAENVVNMTA